MGIYTIVNNLKNDAMNTEMVNMSSFGDISLYDNKATILYPYINIDIVNNQVFNNGVKRYIFRIYVIDRNEPYQSYNKTELILNTFVNSLDIPNYTINYFTLDFQDVVNGVYTDIPVEIDMNSTSQYDNKRYIILENGDFVSHYLLNEVDGKIPLEKLNIYK